MWDLNQSRLSRKERPGRRTLEDPDQPAGNDYSEEEIEKWYRDEEKFHDQFTEGLPGKDWVFYQIFNEGYAFNEYFHPGPDSRVLDFGCAEGRDIELFRSRQTFRLFGIDASETQLQRFREKFKGSEVKKATHSGKIDFEDDFFDYIVELSTLHHIPNVSYVLSELSRVLKPEGMMIVREPVSFMRPLGKEPPKEGLSPRERGISVGFMLREFRRMRMELMGFRLSFSTPVMFAVAKFTILEKVPRLVLAADKIISRALSSNMHYYRRSIKEKTAPGVAYYIVKKG